MTMPYRLEALDQKPYEMPGEELDRRIARIARYWTEIDDDLQGVAPERAAAIRDNRLGIAKFDYARTAYWHDPEGVDVIADLPYLPDGGYERDAGQTRGHLLDLYLPHEAFVRGGATLPVFIDIHGGGFTYGHKELNRNFNTHLAAEGFAVFSLNYRPAPQTDLRGQLADVQAALRSIRDHLRDWPVSERNVFLTGDSAGAALAWLTILIERNPAAARAFGIDKPSGIAIAGGALVSGVFDLARHPERASDARRALCATLGEGFFDSLGEDAARFLTPWGALCDTPTPDLYLLTSSDDFIQSETLQLATALAVNGADFELHDVKTDATRTLGHVFPVCMTWLEESRTALRQIRDFAYRRCR